MYTSPQTQRRHWMIAVAIAVACLVVTVAVFMVRRTENPAPNVPAQPTPATAQPPATSAPAMLPPTTAPAAATPLPPDGDERGCPWEPGSTANLEYDATDPYCAERHNQYAYDNYYAGNPAYDCPDGRNQSLGPADLHKFVPCLNGTLRLEVQYGNVTLHTTTDDRVRLFTNTPRELVPNPSSNMPWVIWKGAVITDGPGSFFRLAYFNYPELQPYNAYYRKGATGKWTLMINPGDERFSPRDAYQVVLFWNDPNAPSSDDVPLPPGFNWSEVEKHKP